MSILYEFLKSKLENLPLFISGFTQFLKIKNNYRTWVTQIRVPHRKTLIAISMKKTKSFKKFVPGTFFHLQFAQWASLPQLISNYLHPTPHTAFCLSQLLFKQEKSHFNAEISVHHSISYFILFLDCSCFKCKVSRTFLEVLPSQNWAGH